MKQSPIIFLALLSLSVTFFTSSAKAQSTELGHNLRGENTTLSQGVNGFDHSAYKQRSLLASGTKATMTMNSFEKGGDGGGPSECDEQYHSNSFLIVALSTKWYNHGQRCFKYINIYYKDTSVRAQVIDECDSNRDCGDNIVDASYAVWVALQVSDSDWGETEITWSDV
ncbi:putative ripening-related protein 1 [Bidens hawaiensis]|uniref:putative ripening-related protein 1 n=1 Tax=Bidens hawaiensis TaxID=980011 RepID=UPI004049772B